MAVEYEISSDVAVIKETGSVSQCARVTQMYSGQITYDDEAGSKFATATINGKSQRVMLCIAVSGTVTYDDVPSLYSTVDGHRCLNIVTPTETGTPDDVPSLYETVVIDGQNVRAVRCIMINKTPVYDGVSSTCTFTGDDGKTHTAQLVNKITGGSVQVIIKGTSPLVLPDAIANSLSYVKAFGGTEQRNLPDGYIERQFIYMMDGSYLLTDIVPTYDGKIEMDFQTTSLPSGNFAFLGGRSVNTVAGLQFASIGSFFIADAFTNTRYTSSVAPTANTRYKFTFNNQKATLESGDSTLFTNTFTGTGATGANLVINGFNNAGTVSGGQVGIYLYSFKVWNGQGELVMDLVPAVQKGTVPVVGFYDTVSKTFKTATAGTFAAGGEAVPTPDAPMGIVSNNGVLKARHQSGLPLGYTLLDYIATANGSYINTGITPTINAKADIKFVPTQTTTMGYWGARSDPNRFCCTTFVSGTQFGVGMTNNTWPANRTAVVLDSIYDCVIANGYANVNGTEYTETPVESFGNANTFCLGIIVSTGGANYSTAKYYKCKLWENNVLVFDGIPAKNANNVIGMYDLVSGQFFTNAGTGDFTAGDPVSDPVEIYTDGVVETINVHGKNLFDKADNAQYIGAYVNSNTGVLTEYNFGYCFCVPCKPNTTYTLSGMTGNSTWGGFTSNSIGTVSTAKTVNNGSLTTGANDKYLIGIAYTTTETPVDYRDTLQIEQGSTATDYVPYYDGGTATAEMLLKVGDYQDVQSIIDGVVTRNVGVKVLDGTENWQNISGYYNISKTALGSDSTVLPAASVDIICTHYETISGVPNRTSVNVGGSYVNFRDDNISTLTNWKQYLADQYAAGTPVIVIYPLATPTTESVTGQTLQVTDGDNVLEITQASLNGLNLEAEYQAAVSLTIQEVQDANLDPNVQVTIN